MGLTYYTFSSSKVSPLKTRIMQAKGGTLVPITDWVAMPDLAGK